MLRLGSVPACSQGRPSAPESRLKVYTREKLGSTTLDAVYRFSSSTVVPGKVRHFYAVGEWEKTQLLQQPQDWALDGIEGYMYPADMTQPAGTVPVWRTYHPLDLASVIFPAQDAGIWTGPGKGFNQMVPVLRLHIGYAPIN